MGVPYLSVWGTLTYPSGGLLPIRVGVRRLYYTGVSRLFYTGVSRLYYTGVRRLYYTGVSRLYYTGVSRLYYTGVRRIVGRGCAVYAVRGVSRYRLPASGPAVGDAPTGGDGALVRLNHERNVNKLFIIRREI